MSDAPERDPHYLHAGRPLEALVSPPIDRPRALAWLPGGEAVLVATVEGALHEVSPSLGTRRLFDVRGDPAEMALAEVALAVLGRDGVVDVHALPSGRLMWRQETGLLGALHVRWWRGGVAVVGDDLEERRALVYAADGVRRARVRLPRRTALGTDERGRIVFARSTEEGLAIAPFGERLPPGDATAHVLRFEGPSVVSGVAAGGVTVWAHGEPPVNVKLFDVTAVALTADANRVALGTRAGAVAVAVPRLGQRVQPAKVRGHEGPVVALAFSPDHRYLASAADRCWVWAC